VRPSLHGGWNPPTRLTHLRFSCVGEPHLVWRPRGLQDRAFGSNEVRRCAFGCVCSPGVKEETRGPSGPVVAEFTGEGQRRGSRVEASAQARIRGSSRVTESDQRSGCRRHVRVEGLLRTLRLRVSGAWSISGPCRVRAAGRPAGRARQGAGPPGGDRSPRVTEGEGRSVETPGLGGS
jgi:hypothetical protein